MEKEETVVDFIKQEFIEKMSNENYDKSFDEIIKIAKNKYKAEQAKEYLRGYQDGKKYVKITYNL